MSKNFANWKRVLLLILVVLFCSTFSQFAQTKMRKEKNILGGILKPCCLKPLTGFYRDGACRTGPDDHGTHIVCAKVTAEFLEFSKSRGNDLITPSPENRFPGLKPGDKWCLCAGRWKEALDFGLAPPIILESTHEKALEFVPLEILKEYGVDE